METDIMELTEEVNAILDAAEGEVKQVIKEPTERWARESNVVKREGKKMPERVPMYRRLTGKLVMLPTATIGQSATKRYPDGSRVFVRKQEDCLQQPSPIDQTCDICLTNRNVRKLFFNEYDYSAHMDSFHPREYAIQERRREEAERKEDRELMRRLVERGVEKEVADVIKCDECGKEVKSAFGLQAHKRSHLSAVPV